MAHLRIVSGPGAGRIVEVHGAVRIGRDPTSEVALDDSLASRAHARVRPTDDGFLVEDLGSTNGTRLNGVTITRSALREGDRLEVGRHVLTLEGAAPEDRPTATILVKSDSHIKASVPAPGRTAAAAQVGAEHLHERLDLFSRVGEALSSTISVDELLDRILAALFEVFEQAEHGFVILAESPAGPFQVEAQRARRGRGGPVALSRTVIEHVLAHEEAVLSHDAAADTRFAAAQSIIAHGIRSVICAPLTACGETLGVLHLDTTDGRRPFDEPELHTLAALGAQIALRIRHARLVAKYVEAERLAAVGQTVAGLAHCVKNILNGVQGGSYILDRALKKNDPDSIQRGWAMVKRNTAFMSDLVLDMLSYAREREPVYEPVDARQLLETVRDLAGLRVADGTVTISCEVDAALETVLVDAVAMKRCLLNLAGNAVEACAAAGGAATPDKAPHVHLACGRGPQPDTLRFTVSDNGCGISEEHLGRLFTLFFSTKGSKGSGLGLAVCKKIVEEHGGVIHVASKVGEGTEFAIDLPMRRLADTDAGRPTQAPA
jgi:two-component system NtrC family sensor kinase